METNESALEEGFKYGNVANIAQLVDEYGVQWLLTVLPDFMVNSVEMQKIHEITEFSNTHTFGKGVEI